MGSGNERQNYNLKLSNISWAPTQHDPGRNDDFVDIPDSNVSGASMGPTWVLSAPDGPHVCPMDFAIRDAMLW